jgi:hypothetical protein
VGFLIGEYFGRHIHLIELSAQSRPAARRVADRS